MEFLAMALRVRHIMTTKGQDNDSTGPSHEHRQETRHTMTARSIASRPTVAHSRAAGSDSLSLGRRLLALATALGVGGLLAVAAAGNAEAQQVNTLGRFQDWTAYTMTENGAKVCYVASQPKKDEGNYTRRGDIYALITHRPARDQFNVVTIYAGYPYDEDASVEMSVDEKSFQLFTKGETAWATDDQDPRIVSAMKAGRSMVVKGTSSRGTATRDTYSLLGVTAALNSIDKACGAR